MISIVSLAALADSSVTTPTPKTTARSSTCASPMKTPRALSSCACGPSFAAWELSSTR